MDKILIADVSRWNNVNFQKLWNAGIRGVIIKAGQYNFIKEIWVKDPLFEQHYKMATEIGMMVGAYYYSGAINFSQSETESKAFMEHVIDKVFTLPLCGDFEDDRYDSEKLKNIVRAAGRTIENMNYYFMAYMDEDNYSRLPQDIKRDYGIWIADWRANNSFYASTEGIKMHQFTSTSMVNGNKILPYDLDISVMHYNLPKAIVNNALFGMEAETWGEKFAEITAAIAKTIRIWGE